MRKKLFVIFGVGAVLALVFAGIRQKGTTGWQPKFRPIGVASWYGPGFHGRRTARGERFNTYRLTAAHRSLPFGTKVTVINLDNGRTVEVEINDRGPYVGDRIIDLSWAAASKLDMIDDGTATVRLVPQYPSAPQSTRQ